MGSAASDEMTAAMTGTSDAVKKHYELNSRFTKVGDKNVWVEFTGMAREYNAVNLGQVNEPTFALYFSHSLDKMNCALFAIGIPRLPEL